MGCATSKQKERLCRNCQKPCSPPMPRRSYSVHVHHPPDCDEDAYHVVALTSSTLGSLRLDAIAQNLYKNEEKIAPIENFDFENAHEKRVQEFSMGMIEAKTWSKMIEEKIPKIVPKTPVRTPPGEPETINAWELMEGLEDTSPLRPANHLRSFSFHVGPNSIGNENSKPMWLKMADSETDSNSISKISEFDPDMISTFRKAKEEENCADTVPLREEKSVKKRGESRVVLFFTSLRGVRKTYEDCCHVRVIMKGIGVRIDERDVSMHSGFKEELKELLGDGFSKSPLPRVFLGGKYIGGAEEIRRMHEEGELEKLLLDSCALASDGGGSGGVCEACGDIRFVPCERCSGSCKIYYEGEYDDDDEDEESDENECGFQRCPDCNENGLIRCPICCD